MSIPGGVARSSVLSRLRPKYAQTVRFCPLAPSPASDADPGRSSRGCATCCPGKRRNLRAHSRPGATALMAMQG